MGTASLKHILHCHPEVIRTDIVLAENAHLFTEDGKRIIDFEAGVWCTALGHCHPRINSVLVDQAQQIVNLHYKLTSDIAETLAEKLLNHFHWEQGKTVFLSSGSEAVQLGVTIATLTSKGDSFLTFSDSYLAAYANFQQRHGSNAWTEVDFRKCSQCSQKSCSKRCEVLEGIDFGKVSAFVFEPGNSGGRVLLQPNKLVTLLASEVKQRGGLVIANEVTTGFGRTGKWFGHNHYDIEPDIVALGKALGNGYPISAVVMSEEIAEKVESLGFRYVQSHQNDPLGCAIANEVITVMEEDHIVERSQKVGEYFCNLLKRIQNSTSMIKEVRGRGLMIAIELSVSGIVDTVFEQMLERGYFIGASPTANIVRFYPALTIAKEDIAAMCGALEQVLGQLGNVVRRK